MNTNKETSRKDFLKIASTTVGLTALSSFSFFPSQAREAEVNGAPLPSPSSSQKDFEFYAGKWKIRNKKLKTLFNNSTEWIEFDAEEEIRQVLFGLGYVGQYKTIINNKPFEGAAFHLFNPETKLWSNYWADSNRGVMEVPVVGSYNNDIGLFYAKDTLGEKKIDLRFHWDVTNKDKPVWSQAFSDDGRKTWETNWIMYYSRQR